ncbi:hypothetical protein BLNAU_11052 [Blattamonas nauphoetae]|uniref:Cyclin N-terminal domain-containing protein n=1 Tax=Blattamonas nauphoetae TaxID=2049346 RepID=A0ABQ9XSU9_9EUKA|nr:hypothetical protein BLNAU_11052 [Blattamonas nauphoetae]
MEIDPPHHKESEWSRSNCQNDPSLIVFSVSPSGSSLHDCPRLPVIRQQTLSTPPTDAALQNDSNEAAGLGGYMELKSTSNTTSEQSAINPLYECPSDLQCLHTTPYYNYSTEIPTEPFPNQLPVNPDNRSPFSHQFSADAPIFVPSRLNTSTTKSCLPSPFREDALPSPILDTERMTDQLIQFTAYCITSVAKANTKSHPRQDVDNVLVYLLQRMRKHAELRPSELMQALAFMDDLSHSFPVSGFAMDTGNCVLATIVCVMIAHKFNSDKPYSNAWWAQVFGVQLSVLNQSEESVLQMLNWKLEIPLDVYRRYYVALVEGSEKKVSKQPN